MRNFIKILIFLVVLLSCLCVLCNGAELRNRKIAWGFRREGICQRPILDKESREIIEKYNGICIGDENEKVMYLTFDAGYEAGYTNQILDVLKKHNVKAAFFITGHYLNTAEDEVKRMISEGHIVGNHTVNHKCLVDLSDGEIKEELKRLDTSLFEKFNYEMTYFRPPKGEFSERVIDVVSNEGYKTVMWSSAYDDWDKDKQNREEYGTKKILDNLHNGCVLLLHSTSKDNANILDNVLKEIKEDGYEIRSLDEYYAY